MIYSHSKWGEWAGQADQRQSVTSDMSPGL